MKKQSIITEENYQKALEKLEFIKNEEIKLEKISKDNQYDNLKEFIINLKRQNSKLDSQINFLQKEFLQKEFLQNFYDNKIIYEKIENKINQLIFLLATDSVNDLDTELLPMLKNYPTFKAVFEELKELISIKKANTQLLNYINDLQTEKNNMLTIKTTYEKQHKPKRKILKKKNDCE